MGCELVIYGLYIRAVYGICMGLYGLCMGFIRVFLLMSMASYGNVYGMYMNFIWDLFELYMGLYGLCIDHTCVLYGFFIGCI